MTPKRSACQSSEEGVGVLSRSVVTAFILASSGESAESLSSSPSSFSEKMSREAEEVAVVIGAEHEGLVEFLRLELEPLEALLLELGFVATRLIVLLIAMSARKSRTRAA
eukprot:1453383-Pleurochrysis_carterae.AAC.1